MRGSFCVKRTSTVNMFCDSEMFSAVDIVYPVYLVIKIFILTLVIVKARP